MADIYVIKVFPLDVFEADKLAGFIKEHFGEDKLHILKGEMNSE